MKPGIYNDCRATKIELFFKSHWQVEVTFQIGDESLRWYGHFTSAAEDIALRALKTMGCVFPSGNITDFSGYDDKPVQLDVRNEEYQGKTTAKICFVNENNYEGVKREQPPTELAAFKTRMAAKLGLAPVPKDVVF